MQTISVTDKTNTYTTLEQLVKNVEGRPFFEVSEGIQQHLDELIEATRMDKSQQEKVFSDEDRKILEYGYYLAIQGYSSAGQRKLGGPYFLHPHEAFTIALKAGVVDIPSLTAVLYHDIIEELIETSKKREYLQRLEKDAILRNIRQRMEKMQNEGHIHNKEASSASLDKLRQGYECRLARIKENVNRYFTQQKTRKAGKRKRRLPSREEKLIRKYIDNLQQAYYNSLITIGIEPSKANDISIDTIETLRLLTRRSTEIYYKSISNIFAPRYKVENEVNIERAITAKFCDRIANSNDLERAEVAAQRNDCILYVSIIYAFENNIRELINEIGDTTKKKSREHHVSEGEFSGQQRLYQCFKNIVLINRYRERKIIENRPVPAVAHLYLAGVTLRETRIILNHLCTYHCADDTLNPQKVYEIYQQCGEYARLGGFSHVTRSVKADGGQHIGFDGILEHFFDARVRGDEHALDNVYEDRSLMFKLALALNYIARNYVEQNDYILQGLTQNGLKPRSPVNKG